MKSPRLVEAVREAADKVQLYCFSGLGASASSWKRMQDLRVALDALDASPELEPRAWECDSRHLFFEHDLLPSVDVCLVPVGDDPVTGADIPCGGRIAPLYGEEAKRD